jgi:hypothetical protein
MKRTLTYAVNDEPLITSKITFDILLKQENPSDLIALYHFYYYTAKWQNTNRARATTSYTANGLKWSEPRVRKNKKVLLMLGFIEDHQSRNPDTKEITGHYVKVNLIFGSTSKPIATTGATKKSHPVRTPPRRRNDSVVNLTPNALKTISSLNALNTTGKEIEEEQLISKEINYSSSSCKKQKNKKITPNEFLKFWELYPKKTDKGKCKTLWNKICQRKAEDDPDFITIEKAVKEQIETERWKEGFIPLPYTWLNQSRWLDDPAEMKSSYTKVKDPKRKSGHYEGKGAVKHKTDNKVEL